MNPAISIIVPVYKAESFLTKCIESVLCQTFSDFELILVDDGSPDNSGILCDEYAKKDKRIKVIHKENEGVSAARNDGINNANGKYLTFIDSDDWVEPNMLEEIFGVLENANVDVMMTGLIFDYLKEKHSVIRSLKDTIIASNKSEIGEAIIALEKAGLFGYVATKIYRTELIKRENIKYQYKVTYMEDLLFTCEIFKVVKSIYFLNKAFYHYSIRDENSLSSKFTSELYTTVRKVDEQINILFEYYGIKSKNYPTNLPDGYVNGIQTCVYNIYHKGCNWTHNKRIYFLRKILKDDKLLGQIDDYNPTDFYSKLFLRLYKTNNAFLIDAVYIFLFTIRYHLTPIYRMVRKKLL